MSRKHKSTPVPRLYRSFIDYPEEPRLAAVTVAFRKLEQAFQDYETALSEAAEAHGWLNETDPQELARRQTWFDGTCVQVLVRQARLLTVHAAMEESYDLVAGAVVWNHNGTFVGELLRAVAVHDCLCVKDLDAAIRCALVSFPDYVKLEGLDERHRMRVPTYFHDRAGIGLKGQ